MSTMDSARMAGVGGAVAAATRPNRASAIAKAIACVLVFAALVCTAQPASAQFTQQGQKLVGSGAAGLASQGSAVALSADGNTAIVGGESDNSGTGAAWEFIQSSGVWSQQGSKLVGTGYSGAPYQGISVALSADSTTAIVGGAFDNSDAGAAWVFTLSGNVKLPIGTGAVGKAYQGYSVALSADGNTAIVGGPSDNSLIGAAWVFTQSAGVWTQQGAKLVGTGYSGQSNQGRSVALSADGNIAIVGGPGDNSGTGAVWFFSRSSNGIWSQQGSKQIGASAVGAAEQGFSVALSADGNTAVAGGYGDNSNAGAVWVFTRNSNGSWSQQGSKLVGKGAVGSLVYQGCSVALSADGNTAIVGGYGDNSNAGAVWVFTRNGGVWNQGGTKLPLGTGAVGSAVYQGYSVALSADGNTAIVGGYGDNSNAGATWVFVSPAQTTGGLLSAIPTSGQAPLAVTFRAIGLTPSTTYTVDFGDGTTGAFTQSSCFGTENGFRCSGMASHTYGTAGTYTAALLNALGLTLSTVTITAGGNLVRPLRPPLGPRGTRPPPSPPVAISTSTSERHSLNQ
jgi:hypothetical protein